MTTISRLPECEKHKLLRTVGSGASVVSSAALHDHLGSAKYQEFIEFVSGTPQPDVGFDPEYVEFFLAPM